MLERRQLSWTDYRVGMTKDELVEAGLKFEGKEWDLESKQFIGKTFSELIPTLIKESRFHPSRYHVPEWIGDMQGGIIQANFKAYEVNPHELPGEIRQTGSGKDDHWLTVTVDPNGELDPNTNPLLVPSLYAKDELVLAFTSKVLLNNLGMLGSYGGVAHFPMLDIVHPATSENVEHLIKEVRTRCKLDKFFVLRSSDKGMMVVGPELIDEENFRAFLISSLKLNHMEVAGEFWVDDRWVSRSAENLVEVSGNITNPWRYDGILRVSSLEGIKPEEPRIIAASF